MQVCPSSNANYFTVADVQRHLEYLPPEFQNIRLTPHTRRLHKISGWMNLSSVRENPDGTVTYRPLFDVWTGFNNEKLPQITETLRKYKELEVSLRAGMSIDDSFCADYEKPVEVNTR